MVLGSGRVPEVYKPSRDELEKHPSRPRHIFKSVLDFWSAKSLDAINDLNSQKDQSNRSDQLIEIAKKDGAAVDIAPCTLHGESCKMLRASFHVAGIPCVSWSPFGKRKQTDGKDFEAFCGWGAQRRRQKDGMSPRQPCQSDASQGVSDIMIGTEKELNRDLRWAMARPKSQAKGKKWTTVCSAKNPHRAVLTKVEEKNLDLYIAQFGGGRCYNLNQNCDQRPIVSHPGKLFTLIRNLGIVWVQPEKGEGRFLCPEECALYQALPIRQELIVPSANQCIADAATSFNIAMNRSRAAMGGQVGNGMNCAVVGSFLHLAMINVFTIKF
eukprot:Skav200543  [mRNA]  locus=scaffold676:287405:290698:+ [translate_table: standard]